MEATIFDIKRFAVHDGDGIRTTVFFKGCPLSCVWCHNPEGIEYKPQLAYYKHKCINCGECINVCPTGSHFIQDNMHTFNRDTCIACNKCTSACLKGALSFYGSKMTVEELLPLLLEDKDFYDNSNGGVTLSGGECLTQPDFCEALLKKLKAQNIHTAVDTCGLVTKDVLDKVMPYTDIFLYDLKAYDEDIHIKGTGQSNRIILENLKYLDSCGKPVEIRIPYVPQYNSDQIEKIAEFLKTLNNITKVRVLPYHNFAGGKYEALGMKNTLPLTLPTSDEIDNAEQYFKKNKC